PGAGLAFLQSAIPTREPKLAGDGRIDEGFKDFGNRPPNQHVGPGKRFGLQHTAFPFAGKVRFWPDGHFTGLSPGPCFPSGTKSASWPFKTATAEVSCKEAVIPGSDGGLLREDDAKLL